jgi:hypothetical protein
MMQLPVVRTLNAAEQKQLVARILASELFSKSHRLAEFLRFICDQYGSGQAATINEQRIGTEVFGRRPGYNAGDDSIVRSQARFLRQRLEEYFATEGSQEPFVLIIPKGSYVPAFERREIQPLAAAAPTLAMQGTAVAPKYKAILPWIAGISGIAVAATLAFAIYLNRSHNRLQAPHAESPEVRAFWGSIFSPDRTVLLVPADSTLVLLEELSGKPVRLLSYINKDYLNPNPAGRSALWDQLTGSQYTSMADLNLVAHLERIPEAASARTQIRYARDLSLKELKEENAILIGGMRANPWVELFSSTLSFEVDFDSATQHNVVRNRVPGPHEQPIYWAERSGASDESRAYGVIVYLPSLDNQGHVLLVEGTNKAGTEAAAEFLNGPAFAEFLRKLGANATSVPSFELLLSTGSMDGASYHPAVVCWHRLNKPAAG